MQSGIGVCDQGCIIHYAVDAAAVLRSGTCSLPRHKRHATSSTSSSCWLIPSTGLAWLFVSKKDGEAGARFIGVYTFSHLGYPPSQKLSGQGGLRLKCGRTARMLNTMYMCAESGTRPPYRALFVCS
jgi:hypothetical protein